MNTLKTFEVFSFFDLFEKGKDLLKNKKYSDFLKEININTISKHSKNFLFYTVSEKDIDSFIFLIDNGININFSDNNNNILTFIAKTMSYHPNKTNIEIYSKMLFIILKYDLDWNFIYKGRTKNDFLEIIKRFNIELYHKIIHDYPIKFEKYKFNKTLNKFNI